MVHAPTRSVRARKDLVEHLVEDDEFDEEARHRGLVERRVKPYFSRLVVIDAKPNGLAPATGGTSAPSNGGSDAALEMSVVEVLENLPQVIRSALRRKHLVSRIAVLPDPRLLTPDEFIQEAPRAPVSPPSVVRDCPHHWGRGVEKHVVQPESQGRGSTPEAHHGASVVCHRKPYRESQLARKQLRQTGSLLQNDVAGRHLAPGRFGLEQDELAR
jgi:hypothetical protein